MMTLLLSQAQEYSIDTVSSDWINLKVLWYSVPKMVTLDQTELSSNAGV